MDVLLIILFVIFGIIVFALIGKIIGTLHSIFDYKHDTTHTNEDNNDCWF